MNIDNLSRKEYKKDMKEICKNINKFCNFTRLSHKDEDKENNNDILRGKYAGGPDDDDIIKLISIYDGYSLIYLDIPILNRCKQYNFTYEYKNIIKGYMYTYEIPKLCFYEREELLLKGISRHHKRALDNIKRI